MAPRHRLTSCRVRGFTLIELLVVVAIIALLISILLPALQEAREQAKTVKSATNMRSQGQGVANASTENNGYGPGWDDGELGRAGGHVNYMLTWVDVLFDRGYIGDPNIQLCPSDARPDEVAERRGDPSGWNFQFVQEFGRQERLKNGVRTSYALNVMMHFNWPEDKYVDLARQVYAADGWWTWFGSLNAAWVMAPRVGRTGDPNTFPNSYATMVAWRHSKRLGSNLLFRDGHVDLMFPQVPGNQTELRLSTVDTTKAFTWLPGEVSTRLPDDPYYRNQPDYAPSLRYDGLGRERKPEWSRRSSGRTNENPEGQTGQQTMNGTYLPYDYPARELFPAEMTPGRLWRKYPNRWQDRR